MDRKHVGKTFVGTFFLGVQTFQTVPKNLDVTHIVTIIIKYKSNTERQNTKKAWCLNCCFNINNMEQ